MSKPDDIFEKVLQRKDYLVTICYFLRIPEIYKSIASLSQFHHAFLTSNDQLKLIYTCFKYDFGNILEKYELGEMTVNKNDKKNCVHFSKFYNDWKFLRDNCQMTKDSYFNDFTVFITIEKFGCVQHWFPRV